MSQDTCSPVPTRGDPVQRLKRLDACALSDALDKLGLAGAVSGLGPIARQRRIAGRTVTVKLGTGKIEGETPPHLGTTAVMAARPGDVIVVEQRSGIEAGSWGGILTLSAKTRGVGGVVSDGLVRDVDEAYDYDFPVYARGATVRTARGRIIELATNITVRIGDVDVAPGDYVIADRSGVVFIAAAVIERVLDAAESIAAREAAMAKDVLAQRPVTEVMGASYENMLIA